VQRYIYDCPKDTANQRKHGVSFKEAETAFDDSNAVFRFDAAHSTFEDRWVVLGFSSRHRILFVVHVRMQENLIRIISARKATRDEERIYAKDL